jgi:transcriptional regulator with XRE-family HTH domain
LSDTIILALVLFSMSFFMVPSHLPSSLHQKQAKIISKSNVSSSILKRPPSYSDVSLAGVCDNNMSHLKIFVILIYMNSGKVLKTLRLQANLSQSELAQRLGISRSAVSSYENGTREPNYNVLLKVAAFFNVSTDYLLGHETQQSHPNPIVQLAQDFQRLLDTSEVSTETKTEILNKLKEYLQWKLAQFSKKSTAP